MLQTLFLLQAGLRWKTQEIHMGAVRCFDSDSNRPAVSAVSESSKVTAAMWVWSVLSVCFLAGWLLHNHGFTVCYDCLLCCCCPASLSNTHTQRNGHTDAIAQILTGGIYHPVCLIFLACVCVCVCSA